MKKSTLLEFWMVSFVVFCVYLSNIYLDYQKDLAHKYFQNILTSSDVVPNTFLPILLVKYQTFQFDQISFYLRIFDNNYKHPYFLLELNEHKYSVYPPVTGVFAVPIYFFPLIMNKIPTLLLYENMYKVLALGRLTASFYSALTVGFFFMLLKKVNNNRLDWFLILYTLFFAFGTNMWSISSRALWMHTFSTFVFALVLLILLYRPRWLVLLGFLLGLVVVVRPTNAIVAFFFLLFLILEHRRQFVKVLVGALPPVVFFLLYNYFVFGNALANGYSARGDMNWSTPLYVGLLGFLASPARSFLFISPPLCLFLGAVRQSKLYILLCIGFLLSVLLFSKWYAWAGANGFGYRMLTDFLPIVSFLSYSVARKFSWLGKSIVVILITYSIFVQLNAVLYLKSKCDEKDNWNVECIRPRFFSYTNKSLDQ